MSRKKTIFEKNEGKYENRKEQKVHPMYDSAHNPKYLIGALKAHSGIHHKLKDLKDEAVSMMIN